MANVLTCLIAVCALLMVSSCSSGVSQPAPNAEQAGVPAVRPQTVSPRNAALPRLPTNVTPIRTPEGHLEGIVKYGYVDIRRRVVIAPMFDRAKPFSEGLAWVKLKGRWGAIDRTGRIVIEPTFDEVDRLSEQVFRQPQAFTEGLAAVYINDKWGYIDKTGRMVVEPDYYEVSPFHKGLALVHKGNSHLYIDKNGRAELTLTDTKFTPWGGFSDGMARVMVFEHSKTESASKYGFIDQSGQVVIQPIFDFASHFSHGLAGACLKKKCGFINKQGMFQIEGPFDDLSSFNDEGLAMVGINGRKGVIDTTGKLIIPTEFEKIAIHEFSEGLFPVKQNEKWGFINMNGKFVIPPSFNKIDRLNFKFKNGIVEVYDKDTISFIDKTGEVVSTIPVDDDSMSVYREFSEGLSIFYEPLTLFGVSLHSATRSKLRATLKKNNVSIISESTNTDMYDVRGKAGPADYLELEYKPDTQRFARADYIVENTRDVKEKIIEIARIAETHYGPLTKEE